MQEVIARQIRMDVSEEAVLASGIIWSPSGGKDMGRFVVPVLEAEN